MYGIRIDNQHKTNNIVVMKWHCIKRNLIHDAFLTLMSSNPLAIYLYLMTYYDYEINIWSEQSV